jgi:hypothetical protein
MKEPDNNLVAIQEALEALTEPGQTFEIRCIHERKYRGMQGFFNDPETAADMIDRLDGDYRGIYVTLNPVDPDLIHRAQNRFKSLEDGLGALDTNVLRRKWLPLDFDPIRVKGISATPTEHANALKLAKSVADTLELVYGFPQPLFASSGNGAHVVFPCDWPNDDATRDAIKAFLGSLRATFSTGQVDIDTSVFNASRIWRLYGTVAKKGEHTLERPHRVSKLLSLGGRSELLDFATITDFTGRNRSKDAGSTSAGSKSLYERSYPKDEGKYRVLNRAALDRIDEWVPAIFGEDARPYQAGYRISSANLGRDLEEDLTIHPWPRGIKDFGEHDSGETQEGRRTPISVIAAHTFDGDKEEAAEWLSDQLGLTTSEFAKLADRQASESESDEFDSVFKGPTPESKKFKYNSIRNAQNLLKQEFRDLHFLVEDYLPEGAFFLSSRPKMRKSWLVLQLGIAVATGGTFLGKKVEQGEVLALFLEENDRRLKRRLDTLFTFQKVPDLSKFHYWTPGSIDFDENFPRGTDGCATIRNWLNSHPDCKLIIIDTWAHFRGHETGHSQNIYQLDYEAVMPLTRLAAEHQLTLIIVHHERKGSLKETQDFIEDTSGSTGLTGGVDGIMAIKGKRGTSEENETRQLAITGRDVIHDHVLNISFDAELGGWRLAKQQDVGEGILTLLRKYPVLKVTELNGLMPNTPPSRIRQILLELRHEGRIENTAQGYRLPV